MVGKLYRREVVAKPPMIIVLYLEEYCSPPRMHDILGSQGLDKGDDVGAWTVSGCSFIGRLRGKLKVTDNDVHISEVDHHIVT